MANASRPGGAGVRELAPKRSWGKVLFKACILLVMAAVGAHWGWGKYAGTRFERELAGYRAAGEPIDPADFVEPVPPDDQNAITDLVAAAELVDSDSVAWHAFDRLEPALPLDDQEMRAIGGALTGSKDALRRLDAAKNKPLVHWKQPYQSPVVLAPETWRPCTRNLPRLLHAAALRSHQLGDDRDALARVGQLLFIARAVDRDPSLYAHLAAAGVRAKACDAIFQISPDLRCDDEAGVAEVRALLDDLNDDASHLESFVRALQGERMRSCDFVRSYADVHSELLAFRHETDLEGRIRQIVLTPFALNDGPILAGHTSRVIQAARCSSNWPAMQRNMPDLDRPREICKHPGVHCVGAILMTWYERPLRTHFHSLTEQRLAGTVLALRLYTSDHAGSVAADLDDLVPGYLRTVPIDPMASGGRRLGFIPALGDPILYSVGDDGIDDGGNDEAIGQKRYAGPWDTHDRVNHLLGQPRIPTESEE